jgi:hypothetical protein
VPTYVVNIKCSSWADAMDNYMKWMLACGTSCALLGLIYFLIERSATARDDGVVSMGRISALLVHHSIALQVQERSCAKVGHSVRADILLHVARWRCRTLPDPSDRQPVTNAHHRLCRAPQVGTFWGPFHLSTNLGYFSVWGAFCTSVRARLCFGCSSLVHRLQLLTF